MKTVMNHSQDGGLLKMIRRTDPVTNIYSIKMPYLCRQIVQHIKCKTMANPKKIKVKKLPFQVILCELNYIFANLFADLQRNY